VARQQEQNMAKTFKDWLGEGEQLYTQAMEEYQALEKQIEDLEGQLQAKREEVNQMATVIGKPPLEPMRKHNVQIVEAAGPGSVPHSRNTIAKALTGRGLGL
jgi:seryl-tRNA synthetase